MKMKNVVFSKSIFTRIPAYFYITTYFVYYYVVYQQILIIDPFFMGIPLAKGISFFSCARNSPLFQLSVRLCDYLAFCLFACLSVRHLSLSVAVLWTGCPCFFSFLPPFPKCQNICLRRKQFLFFFQFFICFPMRFPTNVWLFKYMVRRHTFLRVK